MGLQWPSDGHSLEWWKDFVSTLRLVGYDGAVSIEHEDSLMSSWGRPDQGGRLPAGDTDFEKNTVMTWAKRVPLDYFAGGGSIPAAALYIYAACAVASLRPLGYDSPGFRRTGTVHP